MATDAFAEILTFLRGVPNPDGGLTLLEMFGSRMWGRAEPPPGYDPNNDGVGLCFNLRAGKLDANIPMWNVSFGFQIFGSTDIVCSDADLILVASVHQKKFGKVRMALQEAAGQLLPDTQTDWPTMYSAYQFTIANR